jgi:S-adenosylmethionine-dependent methyltransferase
MAKIKQRGKYDYNFDGFVEKFEKSIYGSFKGKWRLKLLKEDLSMLHGSSSMQIWDAGCGLGQMALWFAKEGHHLTCNDISFKMLQKAKEAFAEAQCQADFYQAPAQEIAHRLPLQDLVLYHAVIEWTAKPLETLEKVSAVIKKGGYLSLLFFNQHSLIYRNVMQGSWRLKTVLENRWYGRGKRLTPPHPQSPEILLSWLEAHGFEIKVQTGIRVFHDYMEKDVLKKTDLEELMRVEYRYCREPTFRNMGRYIHILARKV